MPGAVVKRLSLLGCRQERTQFLGISQEVGRFSSLITVRGVRIALRSNSEVETLLRLPKFAEYLFGFGVRPKCNYPTHVLHCKTVPCECQLMSRGHQKVRARRLARSISFSKRLTLRARSRFGPGGGGGDLGVETRVYLPRSRPWLVPASLYLVTQSVLDNGGLRALSAPYQFAKGPPHFRVQPDCNRLTHVLHRKTPADWCQDGKLPPKLDKDLRLIQANKYGQRWRNPMPENRIQKQNVGNAGEYYIAARLSALNFTATITLGRAERYDILALGPEGRLVKLSVKATQVENAKDFPLSKKDEEGAADDFYYAFVKLNGFAVEPEFWIIPSTVVCPLIREAHKRYLITPGRK